MVFYNIDSIVSDIKLSAPSFKVIADCFKLPPLQMVQEFRFNDFLLDPFSFMNLLEPLANHPTLNTIEFCRDEINEDIACAVIQTLYGNASLKKLNLDGNPISIAIFNDTVIKPYFSTRKDLRIYIA